MRLISLVNTKMTKRKTKKNERKSAKPAQKTRRLLPKLRKIPEKNVKYHYKLKDTARRRRMAINEGVRAEAKMKGRTMKRAAIAKKGRFNILRIYRRNNNIKACEKITRDMRYMDKKYNLGKTKNICGEKGQK